MNIVYRKVTFPDRLKNGLPKKTITNINVLLREYGFIVRFNVLKKRIEIENEDFLDEKWPQEYILPNMVTVIISIAGYHQLHVSEDYLYKSLMLKATSNSYNPIAEWIVSIPWDGKTRIRALYNTLDVQENIEFMFQLFKKWISYIVHCAAADKGVATQGVLILVGPENSGKTTWIGNLLPNRDWTLIGENNLERKTDLVQRISEFGITEFGEISALLQCPKTLEEVKALITTDKRTYRLPYGRLPITYNNITTFAGTDNNRLLFPAFDSPWKINRRFWVLIVGPKLDPFHEYIDMQQVFAEIWYQHFTQNEPESLHLSPEQLTTLAEINKEYSEEDPIFDMIKRRWQWDSFNADDPKTWGEKLTLAQVAEILDLPRTRKTINQIGKYLRQLTKRPDPLKTNGLRVFPLPERNTDVNSHLLINQLSYRN